MITTIVWSSCGSQPPLKAARLSATRSRISCAVSNAEPAMTAVSRPSPYSPPEESRVSVTPSVTRRKTSPGWYVSERSSSSLAKMAASLNPSPRPRGTIRSMQRLDPRYAKTGRCPARTRPLPHDPVGVRRCLEPLSVDARDEVPHFHAGTVGRPAARHFDHQHRRRLLCKPLH